MSLAAVTAGAICLIVIVLLVIDPYGIYPDVPGLSPGWPTDRFFYLRLHKPYALEDIEADYLIIGSSRSARMNPAALASRGAVAYNASLPGVSLFEMARILEHGNTIKPLTAVILELDYYMFRADHVFTRFEDDRLSRSNATVLETLRHWNRRLHDRWLSLFSLDALLLSYHSANLGKRSTRTFFDDGTWEANPPPHWESQRYAILARQKFRDFSEKTSELDMSDLVDMLDYGEAHGIELTLLLSPFHAVQMNAVQQAGRWDSYLRWQREVVAIVDSHPGSAMIYGLEDNPHFITEPLDARPRFFEDGVHYSAWAGDLILACLRAKEAPCDSELRVTPLGSDNIDAYLRSITAVMEDYPRTHPDAYLALLSWLVQD
jgi:hypothetical protein